MGSFWKGRLFVYLFILVILFAIFAKPLAAPPGPFASQLGYYIGAYALPLLFWLAVFEGVYRISKRLRKPENKRS